MEYFKNHFSNWEWRFDGKWPDTSYYGPVYTTTNIAIETFSNLGFTDIDFTPIKLLEDGSINLKWSKDIKNSFYCNLLITSADQGNHFFPIYSNGNIGTNFMHHTSWDDGYYTHRPDPTLIFLPLSNNGFFINGKNHNNSGRWEPDYTNIDTLFNFKNGAYVRGERYPNYGFDGFDLICLPSNKDKDLFYYLYGCAGTSFFGFLNSVYYPAIYMDLGNKKVKTLFKFGYWAGETLTDFILPTDRYTNYTNYINQNDNNVCTLCNIYTKDEKEKINNLYYVIDKPEQVNIRDMFTVNGRTFFYFCPPFAIELPNN